MSKRKFHFEIRTIRTRGSKVDSTIFGRLKRFDKFTKGYNLGIQLRLDPKLLTRNFMKGNFEKIWKLTRNSWPEIFREEILKKSETWPEISDPKFMIISRNIDKVWKLTRNSRPEIFREEIWRKSETWPEIPDPKLLYFN